MEIIASIIAFAVVLLFAYACLKELAKYDKYSRK